MRIDADSLRSRAIYRLMTSLIAPRPVAWVGTRSRAGADNLAPFSYFMGVSSAPPALAISVATKGRDADGRPLRKDTARNIQETGEFTVSMVSASQVQEMHATSAPWPPERSEFDACRLARRAGTRVRAPMPADAHASMECRLLHALELPTTTLFVGEILVFHVDDDLLVQGRPVDRPAVDTRGLDPVARLGGLDYAKLGEVFSLPPARLPDD